MLEEDAIHAYWDAGNVHGRPTISVRIPDGQPVSLEEGVVWLAARIDRGWHVGYRFCARDTQVEIWMKCWRPEEPEPEFPLGASFRPP
jgi:hypothetical protein